MSDFDSEIVPGKKDSKSTYSVFTAWPEEGVSDESWEPDKFSHYIKYIRWGCEEAPTTKKRHLQGYCVWNDRIKFRTQANVLQKLFGGKHPYTATMRAPMVNNDEYIEKGGCYHTWGTRPEVDTSQERGQARMGRKDVDDFADKVLEDGDWRRAAQAAPAVFLRYSRGAQLLATVKPQALRLSEKRDVWLYYGPTQCGKTWDAIPDGATSNDIFRLAATGAGWMDGYHGQRTAVLDDFRGAASGFSVDITLQILDGTFAATVGTKGSTVFWDPRTIIITSNEHPCKWFDWENRWHSYAALVGRLNGVRVYKRTPLRQDRDITFLVPRDAPAAWDDWVAWRPGPIISTTSSGVGAMVTGRVEEYYDQ